jgi:hypothetical protein
MKKSKLETAMSMAKTHLDIEPYLQRIHILNPVNDHDPDDPIKLLEVVEGTLERGIEPVSFTANPDRGIEYPSVIVEVSPREFEAIRKGTLGFGNYNWTLGSELVAR